MPSIAQPRTPVTGADLKRIMPVDLPDGLAKTVAAAGALVFILARPAMPPHTDGLVWDERDIPLALVMADDLDPARFAEVGDIAIRAWFHSGPDEYREPRWGAKTIAVGNRADGA
ncbi:hypothetical protein [Yinghuangia seranimata]|uniref:hypothetical protein n=1 Tax=Yinghuangia seranimata TaxID=408067 RepID=UPI00248AF72C|nr:hypothetical protein [Yinghuangia seranimata]MDI2127944.1 hypothetical protein [Yinghuangia seranimata]